MLRVMKKIRQAALLTVSLSAALVSMGAFASEAKSEDGNDLMAFFKGLKYDFAEPAPLLTNIHSRKRESLNGTWNIVVDEGGKVLKFALGQGYFKDGAKPGTGMELYEISFDNGAQLQVPGDWNSQIESLDRYRDKVVYQRPLEVNKKSGERYYLHFGGSNYITEVFINGKAVGRHEGGYVAFNFDITDHVVSGKNELIVRVDAFLDDTTIPTKDTSDFWKYGGITRDVHLVTLPETHISQYHVYLADRDKGLLKGWVQLEGEGTDKVNSRARKVVSVNIPEAGVQLKAKTNKQGRAEFSVRADLELWSPETPKLYDVSLAFGDTKLQDRIGFRTIETQGKEIFLNGEAVKLNGISMHEETLLRKGMAHSRADAEAQFALIKEMGANFVRLAHYPHNEYTLRLADEVGLMVWSEIPIVSLIDWDNAHTQKVAKAQITDNVIRDLNRASVVLWSIANETFPQSDERLNFLKMLANTVDELDKSDRLVTAALIGNVREEFEEVIRRLVANILMDPEVDAASKQKLMVFAQKQMASDEPGAAAKSPQEALAAVLREPAVVMIDDPLGDVVDVIGYNEYFGWYYSSFIARMLPVGEDIIRKAMFEVMPDIRFTNSFGKPMIISEFGAGAKSGLHSDKASVWTEEYQEKVYQAQLSMLEKSESVQGLSPWILKDFRSPYRQLNGVQDTYNRKGLVSEDGVKKKAFYVLKDYYQKQSKAAENVADAGR
jgi:beta-glucuronidase